MMKINDLMLYFTKLSFCLSLLVLIACSSNNTQRLTLSDIDNKSTQINLSDKAHKTKKKSTEEVRAAYYQYLNNADTSDSSRQLAITRLAQMELELTDKLIADSSANDLEEDALYNETLRRTITLLETSLNDFPNAKGNDGLLYQLARTYDQVGEYDKALSTLEQLASKHKNSTYYAEAQFRIGETAFVHGDYLTAEDAYTEAIISPNSENFYEKAFFKRGWTRYKQELYIESVDDYIESLNLNKFGEFDSLNENDKSLFNEHFRAIGLSFSHLDGPESLQDYFNQYSNFRYLYHTYATISDIYLKQQRYSDAADILNQFVKFYPTKNEIPKAKLKVIKVWKQSGFASNVHEAINEFYTLYHPKSEYWKKSPKNKYQKESTEALKQYIAEEANYFHSRYQDNKLTKEKSKNLKNAGIWYNRYLSQFPEFGRKEGIYHQYGELLYSAKRYQEALHYFEIAAYDNDIILDKRSAYMTISLSDTLYKQNTNTAQQLVLLEQIIRYSHRYVALYPNDKQSPQIIVHAAQLAFNNQKFEQALQLTQAVPSGATKDIQYQIDLVQARTYFEIEKFSDAENSYFNMLNKNPERKYQTQIEDSLALSIYRQAEKAKASNKIAEAMHHFTRIQKIVPQSKIAGSALYDGIALAMADKQWLQVIALGQRFESLYSNHKLSNDVTKNLSIAYLNSNQGDKAAQKFELISSFEKDENVKMAALWQAAKLYEKKGDTEGAIRSYRNFAHQYPQAYAQNMEAMLKLSDLYARQKMPQKRYFWLTKMSTAGRKANASKTTERTIFIAANATIELATIQHANFSKQKLVAPLKNNLRKKKSFMQETIKLYGYASSYGLADITTQATYAIGSIYQDFSIALLESERPKGLSDDELEQYDILLEDQAFPFEDKAIEFYETNMARSKTGLYNEWLSKSRASLVELFPARYSRQPKISGYTADD